MAGNTARLAGGAAAALALAVMVIALFPRLVPQPADSGADKAADTATEDTATDLAAAKAPPATSAPATPETGATASGPTVDTYFLGPDGVAVVAGQATPGAKVTLFLEGAPLAQAQTDAAGNFATTAEVQASDAPRRLTFAENDGAPNGDTVLVRPGTGAATASAAAAATGATPGLAATNPVTTEATATDIDAVGTALTGTAPADSVQGDTVVLADTASGGGDASTNRVTPQADPAPDAAQTAGAGATAPTIVVDAQGARVLGPGPHIMDRVALDAITYDATGDVQIAGRAPADGTLQVYVDNRPVTAGPVGVQGDWRLSLPDVDAGTYTLRIDALTADGTVASRVETPFRREAPADVAALNSGASGMTVSTQTVQPGNTLWAIARDNLGEGIMYVRVFEANADQIRNPDLIYPGQVFVIPDR